MRGIFEFTLKWFWLYMVSSNEVYSSIPLNDVYYIVSSNEAYSSTPLSYFDYIVSSNQRRFRVHP